MGVEEHPVHSVKVHVFDYREMAHLARLEYWGRKEFWVGKGPLLESVEYFGFELLYFLESEFVRICLTESLVVVVVGQQPLWEFPLGLQPFDDLENSQPLQI